MADLGMQASVNLVSSFTDAQLLGLVASKLANKKVCTADTNSATTDGIIPGHSYVLLPGDGATTVMVCNPWGDQYYPPMTILLAVFRANFVQVDFG